MNGRVEVSAVKANVIPFSFQLAGSDVAGGNGIVWFATTEKSYSFL